MQTHIDNKKYSSIEECPAHLLQLTDNDSEKKDLHRARVARLVIEAFGKCDFFFRIARADQSLIAYAQAAITLMNKQELNRALFRISSDDDSIEFAQDLLEAGADPQYKHPIFWGWAFVPHFKSTFENATPKMRALFESQLSTKAN